jgi:hypothetical protein
MAKRIKYISVKKDISSDLAMSNAVVLLDAAAKKAIVDNDAVAMAAAGAGWAQLFKAVVDIEEGMQNGPEIAELNSRLELSAQVGFGPNREYEEEYDED